MSKKCQQFQEASCVVFPLGVPFFLLKNEKCGVSPRVPPYFET